jgi:distribution and morphology protein 34
LSDIKLSGFIVLVFSRQKGLTLVFRNDPLESLKVSSTFDSIPFVRDHLQKEIEGQLRILLMDELPAIIHRLSLRLWVPDHGAREQEEPASQGTSMEEPAVDPLASPPQDAVDSSGNPLNPAEIASLSLDSGSEPLFSRKNLLRLATLTDSHRTLSLFTPSIRDVVFRAWAGPTERGEFMALHTPGMTPALSRSQSNLGSISTTYTFSDGSAHTRQTLQSFGPSMSGLNLGVGRHSKIHGGRKRKKRVVNLRSKPNTEGAELFSDDGSAFTDSASVTESTSSAPSVFSPVRPTSSGGRLTDAEPVTPPMSPNATVRTGKTADHRSQHLLPSSSEEPDLQPSPQFVGFNHDRKEDRHLSSGPRYAESTLRPTNWRLENSVEDLDATPRASMYLPERSATPSSQSNSLSGAIGSAKDQINDPPASASTSRPPIPNFLQFINDPTNGGSIAEQAWMMKMAGEIAKRYEEEREKGRFDLNGDAPPAYAR